MRTTLFLFVLGVFQAYAVDSYAQETKLTIQENKIELGELFNKIEKQTDYYFFYSNDQINKSQKVSVDVNNQTIHEILDIVLKDTDITYVVSNKAIVLNTFDKTGSNAQQPSRRQITGKVTDEYGEPIIGANIVEKGTRNGTVTDIDGNFTISVDKSAVLIVSYIGYLGQEINTVGINTVNVSLLEDTQALEELVVVGYGVQKRSDLTGAVASVKMEDLANNPSNNPLEALQGRISGVDITSSGGGAGAGINILMRGERSLNASNAPLILVDGIAYSSVADVNPIDIESIEVLKDASSTAIYGSRGANGVILITTKKGKEGKTTVSANAYYSFNQLSGMPEFMNAGEYADLKREVARASGIWSSPADDANALGTQQIDYLSKGYSVDWFDLVLNNGYTQNYEVALRGGNEKTTFSLSQNIQDEQGLLKTADHFTRYTSRLSVDHSIRDNLKIGASIMYTYKDQDNRNASFWNISKFEPIAKAFNDDGTINTYPIADRSDVLSPLAEDIPGAVRNNTTSNNVLGVAYLNWNIVKGLIFNTTLGINHLNSTHGYFNTRETAATLGSYSESGANLNLARDLTWENVLNYTVDLGSKHELSSMIGTSTIKDYSEGYTLYGRNQAIDLTQNFDLASNTEGIKITSSRSERRLASFFGRVNYKFEERYLLTATLRADGSSVLAAGNKWGYFPSFAAAWRINQEDWLIDVDKISNLKLRLSWGQSGQSGVSPYSTMATLGNTTYAWTVGGQDMDASGYYPRTISNTDLKWETTTVLNAGIDFGFWNNRLSGTIDAYKSVTSDILMNRLLPSSSGFSSVMQNIGETEGAGIDITLSSLNIKNRDFEWNTDFNFSYNKNKITKLSDGITQDIGNSWFVGEPISVFYDYKKVGIWQSNEASEAAVFDQKPGEIKVKDVNEDGAISDLDRMVYHRSPKFTLGLTNRFSYKNVDLSFFLYGRFGHMINYEYYAAWRPGEQENNPKVDYWTPENPTNKFPRPINGAINYKNTLNYAKGDFLKVKNITLAYNLKNEAISRMGISGLRFYVTLKNHFSFSDLKDYDPERGGSISYPLTKQTVFGLNLDF